MRGDSSRRLIVTADDVGLDRGMTAGAIRAHGDGIVTACSIVATGVEFDDAVARLRDVPSLEVGVHLALVEERALTGIALPKSYRHFVPAYLADRIRPEGIIRELRAQVEKVVATGLRITHLNSHQHLHALRAIFGEVLDLAEEYGIGYVRRVDDRGGRGGIVRRLSVAALGTISRGPKGSNDRTIGVAEAGHLTAPRIVELLDYVGGVTELVAHPGIGVSGYSHWRYAWEEEMRALCDPAVRAAIAERRIQLVAPSAVHSSTTMV